ncbi:major paralogous domain-containing protein [Fibrobacter sp. UWT3]|uniref:fibrobacter succinogenes major paralogous domain-containing protein n=1 Tax=Fibrobacter sp. UWT3 TaxID=1896225 RepID=UPI000BD602DC|nr:fibrobacter succinogenes major paralogous domain-containing protein [Fibrobacter sp. UWT3]SOE78327.1 major paralogous domain-containing protein [Fibrobacter sp. UWT3]
MRNRLSLAFLFSGALLVACSDDDSFIQRPSGGLPAEVADKAELETYECSMDVIGEKVYVVDLGENYECDGDEWFRSYDQPKSSSSAKSSSSVTPKSSGATGEASPCSELPGGDCNYGTLTDTRDGQTYKTVTIGDQVWMAENLNYETENSYCYDDDPSNCAKYGRLYTWAAAMDSVGTWTTNGKGCGYGSECSPTGTIRGICPEGWHLPDTTEWNTLITSVGGVQDEDYAYKWHGAGTALKSTGGWYNDRNGTDAFGFSALPAGYRDYDGNYYGEGHYADFWSSTEGNSSSAYSMYLNYDYDIAGLYGSYKYYGRSVRCLKD